MQVTGSKTIGGAISVQVSLSGYISSIETDGVSVSSGWMSADRFFTDTRFQSRYAKVELSLFTPKFTLVPEHFFSPLAAKSLLGEVVNLGEADQVEYKSLPEFKSVLVYSRSIGESLSKVVSDTVLGVDGSRSEVLPEIWYMLLDIDRISEYNKVIASYADGHLYLVIAQGRSLLLCNTFKVPDFTTAEYFIFLSMKKLQLNLEMSVIYFRTPLLPEEELSLYRYFKSVDHI